MQTVHVLAFVTDCLALHTLQTHLALFFTCDARADVRAIRVNEVADRLSTIPGGLETFRR